MRGIAPLLAATLIAPLFGCGGGSSSNPTPVPTPGPTRTLIAQGAQSDIQPASQGTAYFLTITAPANATLEATVDWTSPANQVVLAWAQGDCAANPNCSPIAQNVGTAKPKTVTAANLAAGNYTLVIANLGSTVESISFQIFAIH